MRDNEEVRSLRYLVAATAAAVTACGAQPTHMPPPTAGATRYPATQPPAVTRKHPPKPSPHRTRFS